MHPNNNMDISSNRNKTKEQEESTHTERSHYNMVEGASAWNEQQRQAQALIDGYLHKVPQFVELATLRAKVWSSMSNHMA